MKQLIINFLSQLAFWHPTEVRVVQQSWWSPTEEIDPDTYASHDVDLVFQRGSQTFQAEFKVRDPDQISDAARIIGEQLRKSQEMDESLLRALMAEKKIQPSVQPFIYITAAHVMSPAKPARSKAISLLERFRWLCGADSRELVDLVLADLARDTRLLRKAGHSPGFIRFVIWRHVYGTIISVSWNAMHDGLKKVARTLGLFRKISK